MKLLLLILLALLLSGCGYQAIEGEVTGKLSPAGSFEQCVPMDVFGNAQCTVHADNTWILVLEGPDADRWSQRGDGVRLCVSPSVWKKTSLGDTFQGSERQICR